MTELFGIDTSGKTLAYARTRAEAEQVSDRIEFLLMDALRMLDFPTGFFDPVNLRLARAGCVPGIGPNCCKKRNG
jgi:ubiquinone/menaquinone biosynthesis C-methylase UbiE